MAAPDFWGTACAGETHTRRTPPRGRNNSAPLAERRLRAAIQTRFCATWATRNGGANGCSSRVRLTDLVGLVRCISSFNGLSVQTMLVVLSRRVAMGWGRWTVASAATTTVSELKLARKKTLVPNSRTSSRGAFVHYPTSVR